MPHMRERSQAELSRAPSYRVLQVMDAIGQRGPISLNQLCALLPGISRAGIWRATATLREYGWVRTRLADSAFELTSKVDLAMANAHFAHELTDVATVEIARLLSEQAGEVDVGMFTAPGRFEIIESSRPDAQIGHRLSLVTEDFALAVQKHLAPLDLLRHITAYQKSAPPEDAAAIQSGEHVRTLRAITGQPVSVIRSEKGECFAYRYDQVALQPGDG